jgi:hypothetical protein
VLTEGKQAPVAASRAAREFALARDQEPARLTRAELPLGDQVRCSPSEAEPIVSSRHDRLSEEGGRADPAYFLAE